MRTAAIVLTIMSATVAIGAHREYGAEAAAAALRARVRTLTTVLRDGAATRIPIEDSRSASAPSCSPPSSPST